jgi:hypothetical protein
MCISDGFLFTRRLLAPPTQKIRTIELDGKTIKLQIVSVMPPIINGIFLHMMPF